MGQVTSSIAEVGLQRRPSAVNRALDPRLLHQETCLAFHKKVRQKFATHPRSDVSSSATMENVSPGAALCKLQATSTCAPAGRLFP